MAGLFHIHPPLLVYKVFNFTFWGSLACFLPYISLYFKQLGFSPGSIGTISALRPIFGFLLLPFTAAAADRFRCRKAVLVASVVLSGAVLLSFAVLPRGSQVPCDVMEEQIWEMLHLNISLPYQEDQTRYNFSLDGDIFSFSSTSVLKRGIDRQVTRRALPKVALGTWRNQTTEGSLGQFPKPIQEALLANQGWLYEKADLRTLFVVILLISSFIEVVVFSSTCQADIATLDALRREYGHVDHYGWNRGFGTLGWGVCSTAAGFILNATRTVEVSCGIEHTIAGYWTSFLLAVGVSSIALVCVAYFKFSYDSKTGDTESSYGPITAVLLSWHYGSVLVMLAFLGLCNGCVWGFLFWHLENLGATQDLLGIFTAINSFSEFSCGFLSSWAIAKFGHVTLLILGLSLYILRFVSYFLITMPWTAVFIEPLHGLCFIMTWTTAVSYMTETVPTLYGGTMQGVLISVHHGLGAGLGFFLTGLLVTEYGARMTFLLYAVSCGMFLFLFLLVQWLSRVPTLEWKSEEPVKSPPDKHEETDEEQMQQTQSLLDSPGDRQNSKLSLKLPKFVLTTKAINQQELW
ncbi:major facilitator superfamily domain-containing protein 6-like [Acanthaster planci]|uniref:Major facilitator superfamily domain-containing protein 6-like n=1 Tax=Acanthaster planci TaxID=133434 RepID=A0A8B7YXW0_ACAPL|nr:major facilitator superfamily domain-containing protein 6-like [Acanthaster planci]